MPASSKAQQRLMGLVKAVQAGDVPKSKVSKAVQKMADKMKEKDVDKYASTKHKGLPNKVQNEFMRDTPTDAAEKQTLKNPETGKEVTVRSIMNQGTRKYPSALVKKANAIYDKALEKERKARNKFHKDRTAKYSFRGGDYKREGVSEETLNENPAVIATASRMAIQNAQGKKVSVNTARQQSYSKKDPGTHKKAKSIFQRIKDKFMKKDKPKKSAPKKQSKSDADYYARQFGGKVEAVSALVEKSKPTNPSKWAYYKAQAKKKFDVYPSAYANAWAAKKYKAAGGGWKKESVELEEGQINEATYVKGKMNSIFKFSGKQLIDGLVGNIVDSPSVERNRIKAQASKKAKAQMMATYLKFKKDIEKIVKPFDGEITGR